MHLALPSCWPLLSFKTWGQSDLEIEPRSWPGIQVHPRSLYAELANYPRQSVSSLKIRNNLSYEDYHESWSLLVLMMYVRVVVRQCMLLRVIQVLVPFKGCNYPNVCFMTRRHFILNAWLPGSDPSLWGNICLTEQDWQNIVFTQYMSSLHGGVCALVCLCCVGVEDCSCSESWRDDAIVRQL